MFQRDASSLRASGSFPRSSSTCPGLRTTRNARGASAAPALASGKLGLRQVDQLGASVIRHAARKRRLPSSIPHELHILVRAAEVDNGDRRNHLRLSVKLSSCDEVSVLPVPCDYDPLSIRPFNA